MPSPERWRRVESIFSTAAELTETERERYLNKACGDDDGLRAEVLELLAAEGRSSGFLEKPVGPGLGNRVLRVGDAIGVYRLERSIGTGGMGEVWLADRADGQYERRVAIKFVRADATFGDLVDRLRRERQLLAELEHPNIARLLDGGTHHGLPYLVMEYVEGKPLDEYCRDASLDIADRIRLFVSICNAVHAAHRQLIVHRDLKPSNILVNSEGEVKLLDFGIAKLIDPDRGASSHETTADLRALTPRYASPEQILGESVTTASDVYALGIILYELVAGVSPYGAETSRHEIERRAIDSGFTAPSEAVVKTMPPDTRRRLRGDLDTIVLEAMHREPARRYGSAEALAEDLGRFLRHEPITARPDSWAYRTSRFVRRHRVPTALAAAFLVALVGGLITTIALYFDAEAARTDAVAAERVASDERDRASTERDRADTARERAESASREAETAREDAVAARKDAESSEKEARRQSLIGNLAAAQLGVDRGLIRVARDRLGAIHEDDRGWAWQRLAAMLDGYLERFTIGLTWCMGLDARRDQILLVGPEGLAFVDRSDLSELHRIDMDNVADLQPTMAVAPEVGVAVIAVRKPPVVWVIDLEQRTIANSIEADLREVRGVAIDSSGRRITAVGGGGTRCYDAETGELLTSFGPRFERAVDSSHGVVVAGSTDSGPWRLLIVDPATGEVIENITTSFLVERIVEITDGTLVAAGKDGYMMTWHPERGSAFMRHGIADIRALVALEPPLVAVGTDSGLIYVVDVAKRQATNVLLGHESFVTTLAYDAQREQLLSIGLDRVLCTWDVRTSTMGGYVSWEPEGIGLTELAISPSGQRIAVVRRDGHVAITDIETIETIATIPDLDAHDLAYHPNGLSLIVAKTDGSLVELNADTMHERRRLVAASPESHEARITAPRHRGERAVLALARGSSVTLVDLDDGSALTSFPDQGSAVRSLDLDEGAHRLLTGTQDGLVRTWSCDTGELIAEMPAFTSAVLNAAFRPGANEVGASAFRPAVIHFFDPDTGAELRRTIDLQSAMRWTYSPDGRRLAGFGVGRDGFVLDAEDATVLSPLAYRTRDFPLSTAFTPDGSSVLAVVGIFNYSNVWKSHVRAWTLRSNRDRYEAARAIETRQEEAEILLDRLGADHPKSPGRLAAAIRDHTADDPALRSAALNELLRRLW